VPKKDPTRAGPVNPPEDEHKVAGNPVAAEQADEETTGDDSLGRQPALDESPDATQQALQEELEEAKGRVLRAQAELENYRKRAAREMEDQRRYANMPLIRDLLPVWDDMGRAIEAAEKADDVDSLLEGFKMVIRQLEDVLARHHCRRIEALGEPFNPHLHEAISQQPSAEQPPGTVVHVAQTGFQLHDRVVRPSKVIVSTAQPET